MSNLKLALINSRLSVTQRCKLCKCVIVNVAPGQGFLPPDKDILVLNCLVSCLNSKELKCKEFEDICSTLLFCLQALDPVRASHVVTVWKAVVNVSPSKIVALGDPGLVAFLNLSAALLQYSQHIDQPLLNRLLILFTSLVTMIVEGSTIHPVKEASIDQLKLIFDRATLFCECCKEINLRVTWQMLANFCKIWPFLTRAKHDDLQTAILEFCRSSTVKLESLLHQPSSPSKDKKSRDNSCELASTAGFIDFLSGYLSSFLEANVDDSSGRFEVFVNVLTIVLQWDWPSLRLASLMSSVLEVARRHSLDDVQYDGKKKDMSLAQVSSQMLSKILQSSALVAEEDLSSLFECLDAYIQYDVRIIWPDLKLVLSALHSRDLQAPDLVQTKQLRNRIIGGLFRKVEKSRKMPELIEAYCRSLWSTTTQLSVDSQLYPVEMKEFQRSFRVMPLRNIVKIFDALLLVLTNHEDTPSLPAANCLALLCSNVNYNVSFVGAVGQDKDKSGTGNVTNLFLPLKQLVTAVSTIQDPVIRVLLRGCLFRMIKLLQVYDALDWLPDDSEAIIMEKISIPSGKNSILFLMDRLNVLPVLEYWDPGRFGKALKKFIKALTSMDLTLNKLDWSDPTASLTFSICDDVDEESAFLRLFLSHLPWLCTWADRLSQKLLHKFWTFIVDLALTGRTVAAISTVMGSRQIWNNRSVHGPFLLASCKQLHELLSVGDSGDETSQSQFVWLDKLAAFFGSATPLTDSESPHTGLKVLLWKLDAHKPVHTLKTELDANAVQRLEAILSCLLFFPVEYASKDMHCFFSGIVIVLVYTVHFHDLTVASSRIATVLLRLILASFSLRSKRETLWADYFPLPNFYLCLIPLVKTSLEHTGSTDKDLSSFPGPIHIYGSILQRAQIIFKQDCSFDEGPVAASLQQASFVSGSDFVPEISIAVCNTAAELLANQEFAIPQTEESQAVLVSLNRAVSKLVSVYSVKGAVPTPVLTLLAKFMLISCRKDAPNFKWTVVDRYVDSNLKKIYAAMKKPSDWGKPYQRIQWIEFLVFCWRIDRKRVTFALKNERSGKIALTMFHFIRDVELNLISNCSLPQFLLSLQEDHICMFLQFLPLSSDGEEFAVSITIVTKLLEDGKFERGGSFLEAVETVIVPQVGRILMEETTLIRNLVAISRSLQFLKSLLSKTDLISLDLFTLILTCISGFEIHLDCSADVLPECFLTFTQILLTILQKYPSWLTNHSPAYGNLVCDAVVCLMRASQLSELGAVSCASELSRLIYGIGRHEKIFSGVGHYFIAAYVQALTRYDAMPSVLRIVRHTFFSLFRSTKSYLLDMLQVNLDSSSKERFKLLYEEYEKYYKFSGEI